MAVHYILVGNMPVPEPSLRRWSQWFDEADRRVAADTVAGVAVSTVFLGLDHSFGRGPPQLFETMVFGDDGALELGDGSDCRRYATWEEAEAGHAEILARLRGAG